MRSMVFAALSVAAVALVPLTAQAEDQAQLQPAGYDPSTQMICMYPVHEGVLIKRPICRTAHAWAAEKEHNRQQFREFQMLSLRTHK